MQDGPDDHGTYPPVGRKKATPSTRTNQQAPNDLHATRVPGMDPEPSATPHQAVSNKPLVGFLISVSRTDEGEYWPLRLGQNVIGSSPSNHVVLDEASVSGVHAVMAVHRNPNDGNRISVGIIDKGSSNGTFVNDNYIGFNPCQCKNYDKIIIGNYELLLLLFDAAEHNLKKSDAFVSKEAFDYTDRDMYLSNDGTRF